MRAPTTNPPSQWIQIALLLILTAFLGAMWGLERTTVPLIAESDFGITSAAVATSFVAGFGVTKAFSNLFAGGLMDRLGRRWVLILGWTAGVPVPLLIIWAPSWEWVVAANVLLGINQGLGWTATILMMMDIMGQGRRGLSTGLNEFVGYVGVAGLTFFSGLIAAAYAPRPHVFFIGIGLGVLGLLISTIWVRETHSPQDDEATQDQHRGPAQSFLATIIAGARDRTLLSCAQAGLVTKINDAAVWGLLPLFLASRGTGIAQIGVVAATYPLVWGIGQSFMGFLGDRLGRKPLILAGMVVQAFGIWGITAVEGLPLQVAAASVLGLGTAAAYPTLIAAVGDYAPASRRASAIGVYRWYRDAGFVVGAVVGGLLADAIGFQATYGIIGGVSVLSAVFVAMAMVEPRRESPPLEWSTARPLD
jgi:MFS family permease